MEEKPKRHWFQFRLSTWLVLIGILAWFMATGPEFRFDHDEPAYADSIDGWSGTFSIGHPSPPTFEALGITYFFPSELRWPVLALSVFLAWKYLWPRMPRNAVVGQFGNELSEMKARPKRRWLQSRLSTWLVLIGILAWTMAIQPGFWFHHIKAPYTQHIDDGWYGDFLIGRLHTNPQVPGHYWRIIYFFPAQIRWPVLALVTFLGWKLIWPRIRRWHSRS